MEVYKILARMTKLVVMKSLTVMIKIGFDETCHLKIENELLKNSGLPRGGVAGLRGPVRRSVLLKNC